MSGDSRYTVESDFYRTAQVSDIALSVSPKGLSRKVLRATLVDNPKVAQNAVELCLVHQGRSNGGDPWSDVSEKTLAQTTVNTPSKFPLDTTETRELFNHLANFYEIGAKGIRRGCCMGSR